MTQRGCDGALSRGSGAVIPNPPSRPPLAHERDSAIFTIEMYSWYYPVQGYGQMSADLSDELHQVSERSALFFLRRLVERNLGKADSLAKARL